MFSHDSDLSRFDAHPQRQAWHVAEAAGVMVAAALIDSAPAILNRYHETHAGKAIRTTPEVYEQSGGSDRAVLYLPGCDQDCKTEARKAAGVFSGLGHVITPTYDKYNVSSKHVADQIVGACEDLGVEDIVIVGSSMGLGIGLRAAVQPKFRDRFPKALGVIGNAPVVEQADIAGNCRLALGSAKVTRYSFAVDKVYAAVAARAGRSYGIGQHKFDVPRLPNMPPREISKYAHAVSRHMPDGCLQGFVDQENVWIIDNLPGHENADRVAIVERTRQDVERILGFAPHVVSDPERPPHSHVATLRYPTIPRQLVEWSMHPELRPTTQALVA